MKASEYFLIHLWLTGFLFLMASTASAESMNGFRLDNALIPVNDIKMGGPPRDGIPSLDDPVFVAHVYPKGASRFDDEFAGEELSVEFDAKHQTARIVKRDGSEIPTIMAFWFAWYAFHPETDVCEAH